MKVRIKRKTIQQLAALSITLTLVFIIGLVCYIMQWDMGDAALTLLTWEKVKEILRETETPGGDNG